jgi:hypothetical protein
MSHVSRFVLSLALTSALLLAACNGGGSPPPANFAIQARTNPVSPSAGTFEVHVTGTGFSPGGQVSITYTSVPNRSGVQQGSLQATVLSDGTFVYGETFLCTTHDSGDIGTVLVGAHDLNTGNVAVKNVPGNDWLCPS